MTTDRDRFEALFTEQYAAVVRYAVRRVGVDSAQEIVAETFLVAWRKFDQLPSNALPWLYATARRLVANEVRRRARASRLENRVEAEADTAVPDHADLVSDRLRVRQALATLSERDREVLRLAEWEQLSATEASIVLGCSVTAVKVRLHRARRRFAAALGEDEPAGLGLVTEGLAR
jgi:RNA polymerase sigma-70 factor, ECF subfamily